MRRLKNNLQIAFSKKEKAEFLLSNLERLRESSAVTEEQYSQLKSYYDKVLKEALNEIEEAKSQVKSELDFTKGDLEAYKQELSNLEIRFKVGELTAEDYRRSEKKIKSKIEKAEEKISELERLLEAKTSQDVGGRVDVRFDKHPRLGISVEDFLSSIKDSSAREIAESFLSALSEKAEVFSEKVKTERSFGFNPVGLVGGLILIISAVSLPWFNIPLLGGQRILDLMNLARLASAFGAPPSEVQMFIQFLWVVFLLILIGGIISVFKPKIGGCVGMGGVIVFTIALATTDKPAEALSFLDSGYFAAWIGALVSLLSGKIYKKR